MANFNLQDYLHDMREEHRADHAALTAKVDRMLSTISDHETRLVLVEARRRAIRWLFGISLAAFLGATADLIFSYLPGWFK